MISAILHLGLSLFVATPTWADGPANIDGLTGRLETAECRGAYNMKLKAFMKLGESLCTDSPSGNELNACLKRELAQVADFDPNAVLEVQAVPSAVNFSARITSNGSQVFRSQRRGYHGDGEANISLMFSRLGVEGDDPYMLSIDELSDDGISALRAMVPVRRQILSDLVYVFVDGCSLRWETRTP